MLLSGVLGLYQPFHGQVQVQGQMSKFTVNTKQDKIFLFQLWTHVTRWRILWMHVILMTWKILVISGVVCVKVVSATSSKEFLACSQVRDRQRTDLHMTCRASLRPHKKRKQIGLPKCLIIFVNKWNRFHEQILKGRSWTHRFHWELSFLSYLNYH